MSGFALPSSPSISVIFFPFSSSSSSSSSSSISAVSSSFSYSNRWNCPSLSPSSSSHHCTRMVCSSLFGPPNGLNFLLHHALDASGIDTTHARAAREGFCLQIKKLSNIERETSITINRGVDLGKTALHIAAEDDSLISHSSVPLPVDAFMERLDDHSMHFCSHYSSSFRSSPEKILECLEKYLYVDKGFRRTNARNQSEQRALYLPSVLTHRLGSATMLSLIYSEILKMLRLWGLLNFDVEIFFPRDPHSLPRGYHKQKSKESDHQHIMTSQSLLVETLRDLKKAFWPFQIDNTGSLFLRAAHAANCSSGSDNVEESAFNLASAKAAQHRLERGVWTSVRFGDMRRALSDRCEASNEEKFDILGWWKVNSSKYRVLSQVARDVLAIPVSTVASESAFSTGGRILDPFRSSLSPMMVEALICTQNWLQSLVPISLRKAMDDVEELEQYDPAALSELASTSNPSPNIITL